MKRVTIEFDLDDEKSRKDFFHSIWKDAEAYEGFLQEFKKDAFKALYTNEPLECERYHTLMQIETLFENLKKKYMVKI